MLPAPFHSGNGQLLLKKFKLFFFSKKCKNLEIPNRKHWHRFNFFLVRLYVIDEVIDNFGNDFGHGKEQSDDVILFLIGH